MKKKAALILGSDSDIPFAQKAIDELLGMGIEIEARIISAHRTPQAAADFAHNAREAGFGVIIAFAGMAAHLAGALAANTTLPVIGVPLKGGALDGLDALLSTVQMPQGVPVATVAVNAAVNAALLAAQILSLADEELAAALQKRKTEMAQAVAEKDSNFNQKNKSIQVGLCKN